MLHYLVPRKLQQRLALRIVRESIRRLNTDAACRLLASQLLSSRQLSIKVWGFEVFVGLELIVPALIAELQLLPYESLQLRWVVMLMESIGYGPSAHRVRIYLTPGDYRVRKHAMEELNSACEPRAWLIPILQKAVEFEQQKECRLAAMARLFDLARQHRRRPFAAGSQAVRLLEDGDLEVRSLVLKYLAAEPDLYGEVLPAVIERYWREPVPLLRGELIGVIGQAAICEEQAIPLLIAAMEEPEGVAIAAIHALGSFGPRAQAALPQLTLELLRGNPRREAAARLAIKMIGLETAPAAAPKSSDGMLQLFSELFGATSQAGNAPSASAAPRNAGPAMGTTLRWAA